MVVAICINYFLYVQVSLYDRLKTIDENTKRKDLLEKIEIDYRNYGQYKMSKVKSNNIVIIGRTRSGKSTIKSLLFDPTKVPEELTLKSDTRDPLIESFYIADRDTTLNIIDTPGLFERGTATDNIRNNEAILKTIEKCANMEITSFNIICFCIAITAGINEEDVQSIKLFIEFLGNEISNNSCLIITHCETKNAEQRQTIKKELEDDKFFKKIASYFKLGVFFSGSINRDNYNKGSECIIDEYLTISEYRTQLIQLFTSNIKPFPITETKISEIRRANQTVAAMLNDLQNAQNSVKQHEYNSAYLQDSLQQQIYLVYEMQEKYEHYKRRAYDLQNRCDELIRSKDYWKEKQQKLKCRADEQECIIQDFIKSDSHDNTKIQQKYSQYFSHK